MPSSSKNQPLQLLSSMCNEYCAFRTRFALLSLKNNSLSRLHEGLILLLEYLQLIAPILLFSLSFATPDEILLPNIIRYLAKFLYPISWIIPDQTGSFQATILSISFAFFLLKGVLFGYIFLVAFYQREGHCVLVALWRDIIKLQGRFIASSLTCIWVSATRLYEENDGSFGKRATKGMTVTILTVEFFYSLQFFIRYQEILPAKNLLSAKNNYIEVLTLIQKFLMQILTLTLSKDSAFENLWIFSAVNVTIDLIKNAYFFKKLPLFSFESLHYQSALLMLVTSLNLSLLATCIVHSINDSLFCLPIFAFLSVVLFPFLFWISRTFLKRRFISLIFDTNTTTPHLLIHKLVAIKELRRQVKYSSEHNVTNSWAFLLVKTLNHHLKAILQVDLECALASDASLDINSKKEANFMMRDYLEKLTKRFPKDKYIKLYAARFYTKKFHLYGDAIKISRALLTNTPPLIKLTAELLLLEIQNAMKLRFSRRPEDTTSQEKHIDLRQYIYEQALLAQAKQMMMQQADLQAKICTEIKKENPSIGLVLSKSQTLESHRIKTLTQLSKMLNNTSLYNLEPLAISAQYHLTLNHSIPEYIHFCKEYSLKSERFKESFDEDALQQQNLFHDTCGFYLISGNDNDAGNILYASKSMLKILDSEYRTVVGNNIVVFTAPCLHGFYSTFYTTLAEKNYADAFGVIARAFHFHPQGYLLEVDYYMHVLPFLTQGFCFAAFIKPIVSNRDFMYVFENGQIDCSTKNIGEVLGLLPTKRTSLTHLKEISPELAVANEAFNMITFPDRTSNSTQDSQTTTTNRTKPKRKSTLTTEKAQEIYNLFTTTGKDVILYSKDSSSSSSTGYSYHCKIESVSYGSIQVKLFTFKKNRNQSQQQLESLNDHDQYDKLSLKIPIITRQPPFQTEILQEEENIDALEIAEYPKAVDSGFLDYFGEKASGWAEIRVLRSKELSQNFTNRTSTRLLTGTERDRRTTRHFSSLIYQPQHDHQNNNIKDSKIISIQKFSQSTGAKNVKLHEKETPDQIQFGGAQSSLRSSNWSKFSYKKRISTLYKASLNLHYAPKFFKFLSYLFYVFFTIFVIGETLLKISLDDDIKNLQLKKDLLRNAELRNYQLITVQSTVRVFWEIQQGEIDASSLGALAFLIPIYSYLVNLNIDSLTKANQNLLSNTSLLQSDIRDMIFDRDVKVYDTYFDQTPQVYETLNSFQALDRIIEAGLKVVDLSQASTSEFTNVVNFLSRNSLNDLIIKNDLISQQIIVSLELQHDTVNLKLDLHLISTITLVGSFVVIFILILWRQYHKEIANLNALCRLDSTKLDSVVKTFNQFKNQLENIDFNLYNITDINIYINRFQEVKSPTAKKAPKRDFSKTLNPAGLRKRYYIQLARVSILFIIMASLLTMYSLLNISAIQSFKDYQEQIYTADRAQTRISLTNIASRELFSTNNTAEIENVLAETALINLLQELVFIRGKGLEFVAEMNDNPDNADMAAMILGDSCEVLDSSMDVYCAILQARGQKVGLLYLIDTIETILKNQLQRYQDSDKSEAVLKELKEDELEFIIELFVVANGACRRLASLINESYEKKFTEVNRNTTWLLALTMVAVVIVDILVWKLLLVQLGKGVNQFKNVLKVLPPELVLSSFILKKFLIKTSKGLLETIKNEL